MVTRVPIAQSYRDTKRVMRTPRHTFNIKHVPYAIQPFFIAPVLPGETMKNLAIQSRVVSAPLTSPLVGWWLDYVFVYIKHRDLDERDNLTDMMLNPAWSASVGVVAETASTLNYTFAGGMDFVRMCLKKTVDDHFRNEGEAWDAFKLADGTPLAGINQETWLNSFVSNTIMQDDDVGITVGVDDIVTAGEIDKAMQQWQLLKMNNLTDMSYEDYLRTHGVRTASVELHRSEIVRVVREWGFPTNTVNPADGVPSTAAVFSISERADKDRYFKEPGFLFGVTVARPKIYLSNLKGAGVGMLKGALPWLPALWQAQSDVSLLEFAEGTGPIPAYTDGTDGYMVDVRDLFVHGDQFVNFDLAASTDANKMALPTATGNHRYVTEAMISNLFKSAGGNFRQDGIVSLAVAGRQVDTSPGTPVTV